MTKKKRVIIISAAAVLLVAAAVFVTLFATGTLFGTPVNDGGGVFNPECELILENGTKKIYATFEEAFSATKGVNITDDVTIKLIRDVELTEALELPVHSNSGDFCFDLNGHKLSRNLSDYEEDGQVIKIVEAATYIIKDSVGGGCISGGKNMSAGGAISVENYDTSCYVTIQDVTITDNASRTYGGGVYFDVTNSSFYTLKNVTITGNTAELDGGGVYIERTDDYHFGVKLKGSVNISDNVHGGILLEHGEGDARMLNIEEMSSDSAIVIDRKTHSDEAFNLETTQDKIDGVFSCFTTENTNYSLEKDGASIRFNFLESVATVKWKGRKFSYDSIPNAWADINNPNKYGRGDVVLVLNENWTADGNKNLDTNVTTDVCGFSRGRLFPEGRSDGSTLTLDLNGHTIDRFMGAEDRDYGNILSIERNLKIVVKNGTLAGGHNDYDGGAVYIDAANAYITFDNIMIRHSKSDNDGGGVYCSGNANHVTFKDCTIKYNECNGAGGGVYIYSKDNTKRDILFTGKVQIFDNQEKIWAFFSYHYKPDDLFIDVATFTGKSRILFPTLTEGSYINVDTKGVAILTVPAEDNEENNRSLSYFHYTPQSENADTVTVKVHHGTGGPNTISLAIGAIEKEY